MKSLFTGDFFRGNRQQLRKEAKTDLIVITANGLLQKNSDETFPFRQDSSFWYLTGINEPDAILVMEEKDEYLIVPSRDPVRIAFEGPFSANTLSQNSGLPALTKREGWVRLRAKLQTISQIGTLLPARTYIDLFGFYTNPARGRLVKRLKTVNRGIELVDLRKTLAGMRAVKQPAEIKAVQKAIDITLAAIRDVETKLKSYKYEWQIDLDLRRSILSAGADGYGFDPIIASGPNASTIHHMNNRSPILKDDILLLDLGASVNNYASDISRTIVIGQPSKRHKEVYESVLRVYDFACEHLRAGVFVREYEKLVENFMGEELVRLRLIKNIERRTVRRFYPHATSHFLGLDAHDAGNYDEPLPVGSVLTIEPGIYIPEESMGFRVEDDFLLTKNGLKLLSPGLPRQLA